MRIALNGSSLGDGPLEEELSGAAAAGFDLVGLRAPQLAAARARAPDLLRRFGLEAWSVNSLEGAGDHDLREVARQQAAWAAACAAPYVVCVPGRRREGLEDAVAELATICIAEGAQL